MSNNTIYEALKRALSLGMEPAIVEVKQTAADPAADLSKTLRSLLA